LCAVEVRFDPTKNHSGWDIKYKVLLKGGVADGQKYCEGLRNVDQQHSVSLFFGRARRAKANYEMNVQQYGSAEVLCICPSDQVDGEAHMWIAKIRRDIFGKDTFPKPLSERDGNWGRLP